MVTTTVVYCTSILGHCGDFDENKSEQIVLPDNFYSDSSHHKAVGCQFTIGLNAY